MTEDKSTRYHRLKRRSEVAALLWSAVCFSGLLLGGASQALRDATSALAGGSLPGTIALMVLALALVHEIGAFPLAFYGGYLLEQRYHLSRQRFAQWLGDHVKAAVIGLLLAMLAAILTYAVMAWSPQWWWLIAGMGLAALVAVLATLAPVILLPLFFRFTPLARPELTLRLEKLATRAGARVVGTYEWALGAKTRKANAALTGLGSTRRILVSDTMLEQYSDDEIEVVLAHELGHHVHHDIWKAVVLESVLIVLGLYLANVALRLAGPAVGLSGLGDPAGLPILVLAAGALSLLLTPGALALSRLHERRADRFALDLTANPGAFISAMRRLGAQNLAEERPSRVVQWLFYSHPPLEERLAAARAWAESRRR